MSSFLSMSNLVEVLTNGGRRQCRLSPLIPLSNLKLIKRYFITSKLFCCKYLQTRTISHFPGFLSSNDHNSYPISVALSWSYLAFTLISIHHHDFLLLDKSFAWTLYHNYTAHLVKSQTWLNLTHWMFCSCI